MSDEHQTPTPDDALLAWIRTVVPDGCTPVGWCHKPIHGHILDKAPDVVDATRAAISESFGDTPHVVLEIRQDDEAARVSHELAQALDRTGGGVLLVGVGYEHG